MIHEIISNLSQRQAVALLDWLNRRVNKAHPERQIVAFDIQAIDDAEGNYARFLIHLIVEQDKEDSLGIIKQLERNAKRYEENRLKEQGERNDSVVLASLFISIMSWLEMRFLNKKQSRNYIHIGIDKDRICYEISEHISKALQEANIFNGNGNTIIIKDITIIVNIVNNILQDVENTNFNPVNQNHAGSGDNVAGDKILK